MSVSLRASLYRRAAGMVVLGSLAAATAGAAFANTTSPFPTTPAPSTSTTACSQFTVNSRKWKKCMREQQSSLTPDERFRVGYDLAQLGQYEMAREVLLGAGEPNDPRLLNYVGYTTRKMGDVDGAIPYYMKALSIDPNYHVAREYLGEGYLQKGDLAGARDQLNEIAQRCGTSCEAYTDLSKHIADFEKGQTL